MIKHVEMDSFPWVVKWIATPPFWKVSHKNMEGNYVQLRSLGKEKAIDQSTLQGEYIGREGAFILDVHR